MWTGDLSIGREAMCGRESLVRLRIMERAQIDNGLRNVEDGPNLSHIFDTCDTGEGWCPKQTELTGLFGVSSNSDGAIPDQKWL